MDDPHDDCSYWVGRMPTAFDHGVNDYWEGKDPTDENPYRDGTPASRQWERGFYAMYEMEHGETA